MRKLGRGCSLAYSGACRATPARSVGSDTSCQAGTERPTAPLHLSNERGADAAALRGVVWAAEVRNPPGAGRRAPGMPVG